MATALQRLNVRALVEAEVELRHASTLEPYRFTYRAELPDRLSAALNMPTTERDYSTDDLPAPFEQNLPEMNLGIFPTAIWKFVARDKMGMLWASSQRRSGRVRFHSEDLSNAEQPASVKLSTTDLASIQDGDALFQDAVNRLRDIPGVAGVQPKVLVSIQTQDEGDNETDARTVSTDTHILKANHPDFIGATVIESICLNLAERVGLPTPRRILSGDGRLLAVRRFDLTEDSSVLGFDEVGAILGMTAIQKYDGSLEQVAEIVREFSGPNRRVESLRQFFTLCGLNNAVRNGDGHLKNFGLVYDNPNDAQLSPVYDVLTTRCFEGQRNDAPALTLDGRKQWDDFRALARFGRQFCQLNVQQIKATYQSISQAMGEMIPDIAAARERYAYAAGPLWVMRAEWLEAVETMNRNLDTNMDQYSGLSL